MLSCDGVVILYLQATLLILHLLKVDGAELDGYGSTVYPWVMVVLVLAIIGLLTVVIIEFIIIFKVIKLGGVPWRSVWLGQMLLFGILLSYLTTLAFVFKPTSGSCDLLRFAVGVCYALMLSVLIIKLLIILSPKNETGFLKFGHQVLILAILWLVQIVINSQWLILAPSSTELKSINVQINNGESTRTEVYEGTVCKAVHLSSLFFDFLTSFVYIMLLRIVALVLSLISYTRSKKKDGKPNSESCWILVATVVTTIVWLIWILIGSFASDAGMAAIAIGLWVTATAKLIILFIPKLHKLATLKDGGMDVIYKYNNKCGLMFDGLPVAP